jgi:Rieske Fe-S protein
MAAGYTLPKLTGCAPAYTVFKTTAVNNKVEVPLALFEKSPVQFVRPQGWYFDIAVHKKEDNTFTALLLQCTHQENQLTPSGNGFQCSLHGSQFDQEGNVRKGPAENALKKYSTSINSTNLIINI